MAILRAGPWGRLTEPFNDVPDDTSVDLAIFPVNCAKGDWPNQTWGARYAKYSSFQGQPSDAEYGVVGLGESVSQTSDSATLKFVPGVSFNFCYQATGEFDVTLNWEFTGEREDNFGDLSWSYETINGDSDSYFNTPTQTGFEVITLPATTFCQVSCTVQGYLLDFDKDITVTASLT